MKYTLPLLAGLLLSVPALADRHPERNEHSDAAPMRCLHHDAKARHFQRADLNGDKRISREEHLAQMIALSDRHFTRADANADGYLTRDEVQAAFAERASGTKAHSPERCHDNRERH